MPFVRVKGFQIFKDRHGKQRCYHRKTKAVVDLKKFPMGSGRLHQPPLAECRQDFRAHQRRFANYVRAVLSILFSYGLERGYVEQNPAQGVKDIRRPRGTPRANRPWSDAERYAVLEASSWALKVPIALAMFAGLREGDALTIPRSAYDGAKLDFVTGKTGQRICWPVSSALKEVLVGAPFTRHRPSPQTATAKPGRKVALEARGGRSGSSLNSKARSNLASPSTG
jgi:integrase